jgi:hypothetical protein
MSWTPAVWAWKKVTVEASNVSSTSGRGGAGAATSAGRGEGGELKLEGSRDGLLLMHHSGSMLTRGGNLLLLRHDLGGHDALMRSDNGVRGGVKVGSRSCHDVDLSWI